MFFYVVSSARQDVEAVVAWGWETRAFYAKWAREDDRAVLDTLLGPVLSLGSPQTELAPALLALVMTVLLRDEQYVARVKRHYRMFRDHVERKAKRPARPAR